MFTPFPYAASQENDQVKSWMRQLVNKFISGSTAQLFQGYFGSFGVSAGVIVNTQLPIGWTVARSGAGVYVVTHNLAVPFVNSIYQMHVNVTSSTNVAFQSVTYAEIGRAHV